MPHKVDSLLATTGQSSIHSTAFMGQEAFLRALRTPCRSQVHSNPKRNEKTQKRKEKGSKPLPLVGLQLSSQNITRLQSSEDTAGKPLLYSNEKQSPGNVLNIRHRLSQNPRREGEMAQQVMAPATNATDHLSSIL